MYKIAEAIERINDYRAKILKAESLRQDILNSNYPPAQRDEEAGAQEKAIARFRRYQEEVLQDLLHFPPYKIGHFQNVQQFHATSSYEQSVFIMTKFPSKQGTALDVQLDRVIKAVRGAVDNYNGHKSYLASDKNWHPSLWDNIETYLMACSKAIAIVESKHTQELNPNVTMEWGWMRCTDRRVLFLVEKTFDKGRADLDGLIREEFDWDNPEPDINAAVKKFLT
jgi:hypothetical protein